MTLNLNLIEKNSGKNIENLFANTMLSTYIYIIFHFYIFVRMGKYYHSMLDVVNICNSPEEENVEIFHKPKSRGSI
jgi:hypothetical protein